MSTSLQELKKTKPKYPETTMGTHCMGDNWTVCCPYKHPIYDRYHQTKLVIQIYYKGGIYRVYVCTDKCAKNIKRLAFKQPDKFKKMFIKQLIFMEVVAFIEFVLLTKTGLILSEI